MTVELAETETRYRDYYAAIQLHPTADGAMVEQAYWRLARRYNAEISGDPEAGERLEELNAAYRVLSSPTLRREYDRARHAVPRLAKPMRHGSEHEAPVRPSTRPETMRNGSEHEAPVRPSTRPEPLPRPVQRSLKVPNIVSKAWPLVVSTLSVAVLVAATLLAGAKPALVVVLLVTGAALVLGLLGRRLKLAPTGKSAVGGTTTRPAGLARVRIPGGSSQAVRSLVYQVYDQCAHLGPSDIRAVARYASLSQRFTRGERQLNALQRESRNGEWHDLAREQSALAAELRRLEAALGITAGARTALQRRLSTPGWAAPARAAELPIS